MSRDVIAIDLQSGQQKLLLLLDAITGGKSGFNFSFHHIVEDFVLVIPQHQQMAVFDTLNIEGELFFEEDAELVLRS